MVIKYLPLVKSIAKYFHGLNSGTELCDLEQEGTVGLILALRRYDPARGISLGAFANRWIFGRIFRSLMGTKNLLHNKRIATMELSDKVFDKNPNNDNYIIEFYDHIENTHSAQAANVLKMLFQGHKRSEILKVNKITLDDFHKILADFDSKFE